MRGISLHWTAGDYATVYPAYHFCLSGASDLLVHATHDLRANMREIARAPHEPYAAHTAGRNSFTIGLAICAMDGAGPSDFGLFPLTGAQIEAMCTFAAALVARYGIATANVRTHAEAALDDGYFGAQSDDVRWDIARIRPAPESLDPREARETADVFRARISALR